MIALQYRRFLQLLRLAALSVIAAAGLPLVSSGDDEKVTKQLSRLDAELVKALIELARKYDKDQIPEAAHFFASCALGFGAKDETVSSIKASHETSVYLGRLRGGEPLKETAPITGALGGLAAAYKKILDPWILRARKGGLPESTRTLMQETGVKHELARGAHEYVQATQRFNVLRKAMGLRAILWDFEESRKLILSGWYTCETEDWELKEPRKESPFYSESIEAAKHATRAASKLPDLPERLRSFALARLNLLNPNARTLMLGFWGNGSQIDYWSLYAIPQLPYRQDIPTPTQKFRGETVVQEWVDVEEILELSGKKIPFVKYPYSGETGLPVWFSNGKGYTETGWAKGELPFLEHAGVPIMIRWFAEATPSAILATLRNPQGTTISCRVYATGDERVDLGAWASVLLVPERQLDALTDYKVEIRCKIEGQPVRVEWTFKTTAK